MSIDNNTYALVKQQGQSDAAKGLVPNPNVPPAAQAAYVKGYTGG